MQEVQSFALFLKASFMIFEHSCAIKELLFKEDSEITNNQDSETTKILK